MIALLRDAAALGFPVVVGLPIVIWLELASSWVARTGLAFLFGSAASGLVLTAVGIAGVPLRREVLAMLLLAWLAGWAFLLRRRLAGLRLHLKPARPAAHPVVALLLGLTLLNVGTAAGYALSTPIGISDVKREGTDVTIVAYSRMVQVALEAAQKLEADGISAEVIDLRTLRPMDTETILASVKKTGRLVTIEEGWQQSGVGAEIAARVMEHAFDYLDAPVARVSGKDVPMPYAANLEKLALPSVADVVEAAKSVCYR